MNRRLVKILLVLTILGSGGAATLAAEPLTLPAYLGRVLERDPDVISKLLLQDALVSEVKSMRAGYLPQLRGRMIGGYLHSFIQNGGTSLSPFETGINTNPERAPDREQPDRRSKSRSGQPSEAVIGIVGATLTVPVYRNGSFFGINMPHDVKAKRSEVTVAGLEGELSRVEIIGKTTELYLSAIELTRVYELRQRHFATVSQETARVHERLALGIATTEELSEAELQYLTSASQLESAHLEVINSFLRLSDLIGISDPGELQIQANYPAKPQVPDTGTLILQTLNDHPTVRIQDAGIEGAKANVNLRRTGYYPTVEMENQIAYQTDNNDQRTASEFVSLMKVAVPIFDFGQTAHSVEAAKKTLASLKQTRESVRLDLRKQLFEAAMQVREAEHLVKLMKDQLAAHRKVLRRWDELETLGRAPVREQNNARLEVINAELALENAKLRLFQSYASLQQTAGGSWVWIAPAAVPSDS